MRLKTISALVAATAILAACSDSATEPTASLESELQELVFDMGAAPNELAAVQDRRDGPRTMPARQRPRLTEAQRQCIHDAVEEFRTENKDVLEQLHAIHLKARAARAAGATRAEMAAIFEEAKPLLQSLRAAHEALHKEIRACLAS